MTDDNKPIGYATLREAMAAIIAAEQAKRRDRRSGREKLSLPKTEPQRCPPMR